MATEKQVKYDVDGYDAVTEALRELLNQYPGLRHGEEIAFSVLDEDSGKAMFPTNSAIIQEEKTDITGHVTQTCIYPLYIIYRVAGLSEERKVSVKEWLDNLGRWLEKQSVTIDGTDYKLEEYPTLTGNREFTNIARQTPSYLDSINENHSENWAINIYAHYRNEFDK